MARLKFFPIPANCRHPSLPATRWAGLAATHPEGPKDAGPPRPGPRGGRVDEQANQNFCVTKILIPFKEKEQGLNNIKRGTGIKLIHYNQCLNQSPN